MKITEKHRIKYKSTEAPGEPVEMSIYRDDDGHYQTATGEWVAYSDGTPSGWATRLLNGTSHIIEGEIIPPSLEAKLGTVLKNDLESGHIICFTEHRGVKAPWVDEIGVTYTTAELRPLMAEGWKEVDTP